MDLTKQQRLWLRLRLLIVEAVKLADAYYVVPPLFKSKPRLN